MTRAFTSETSSHQPVYSNNSPETTHLDRQSERRMKKGREQSDRDKCEWTDEGEHKKIAK